MSTSATPPAEPGRVEPNPKWIRGYLGDRVVVDTTDALFVWEHPYYPQWYIPTADVAAQLRPAGDLAETDARGPAHAVDLVVGDGSPGDLVVADAGRVHPESPILELRDRVRFRWDALDRWLEEDVEVSVHPRSPYTRVDVLPSTRHIQVRIGDTIVADSTHPTILFETGLPPRYYLPADDVRSELLTPTATSSACPYKGVARYWSVTVDGETNDDIAWGYDEPLPESAAIQGLVCFYNERVDLTVDGETLQRPSTKFS